MNDSLDPARNVRSALFDLREVLHVSDMRFNGGLRADLDEFLTHWERFSNVLRTSVSVIQSPKPGQGLDAIWLRAICQRAAKVENSARRHEGGWSDVLWHDDNNLFWLVTAGCQYSYSIGKLSRPGQPGLETLLTPMASPLQRLYELAEKWEAETQELGRPPHHNRVYQKYGADPEVRIGARLLFDVINECQFDLTVLADDSFCDRILRNVEHPDEIVWPFLVRSEGESLLQWLLRFAPRLVEFPALPQPQSPRIDDKPAYSQPQNYARDHWIYEKMRDHTCQSLSAELKRLAPTKKWAIISSRNAFKNAADKFAEFHHLPPRRFNDDPADD